TPVGACLQAIASAGTAPERIAGRPAPTVPTPSSTAKRSRGVGGKSAGDRFGRHGARDNRPPQNEAPVGACLQAIDTAGTTPERIAGRPAPTVPCPGPAADRSHGVGACLQAIASAGTAPERITGKPAPTVPYPGPAAKRSRCRSLPAG